MKRAGGMGSIPVTSLSATHLEDYLRRISAMIAAVTLALVGLSAPAYALDPDGCEVNANVPTYASPSVTASGYARCPSMHPDDSIYLEVELTRDGSTVASTAKRCWDLHCATSVKGTNASGNQTWCSFTKAWYYYGSGGSTLIGSDATCEGSAWIVAP